MKSLHVPPPTFLPQGELGGDRGLVPSNFLEEYPETDIERRDRERRDRDRSDSRDRRGGGEDTSLQYSSPSHSRGGSHSSLRSQDHDKDPSKARPDKGQVRRHRECT